MLLTLIFTFLFMSLYPFIPFLYFSLFCGILLVPCQHFYRYFYIFLFSLLAFFCFVYSFLSFIFFFMNEYPHNYWLIFCFLNTLFASNPGALCIVLKIWLSFNLRHFGLFKKQFSKLDRF